MTPASLHGIQFRIAAGLIGRGDPNIAGWLGPGYFIHARNVRNSLVAAVAQAFPVLVELVGTDFFEQAARVFIVDQPPCRGWLSSYGEAFPTFLSSYVPAATLGYIPDVARLEWARVHAARTALGQALDLQRLAALPSDTLMHVRLHLHPGATLICSSYPVCSIWNAHQELEAEQRLVDVRLDENGESGLVTRLSNNEIAVTQVSAAEATFIEAVRRGEVLSTAWAVALSVSDEFHLGNCLAALATAHAFSDAWAIVT